MGTLFVPSTVRSQVITWLHANKIFYPRVLHMLSSAKKLFWWSSMTQDIKEFVATCSTCTKNKPGNQLPAGLLQPLPTPSRPWSHISEDFATGLPPSEGNTVILTVINRFSKATHFTHHFCKALGVSSSLTSGYHPQSNGQTRCNQELETTLRYVVERNPSAWSQHLV